MKYSIIKGDLIQEALNGRFDVITHGCNTQCTMASGLAPQMAKAFGCDIFPMEQYSSVNKLGCIDSKVFAYIQRSRFTLTPDNIESFRHSKKFDMILTVVNSYTQAFPGRPLLGSIPLDYISMRLCFRKINYLFKDKILGLPYMIGCGLAGGDIDTVKSLILYECKDLKEIVFCDIN